MSIFNKYNLKNRKNLTHPPLSGWSHYSIEKLTAGCMIVLKGKTKFDSTGFTVNLHSGQDIAFHINPRFELNYIARNSKINKSWGHEDSQLLQTSPFVRGEKFKMEILVGPSQYMVGVNGLHIFCFGHRIPYQNVKSVEISSDVIIESFSVGPANVYPARPPTPEELPIKGVFKCPVHVRVPTLRIGDMIEVLARVHSLPHSFYLNIQHGLHSVPHPLINYHLNPRYLPSMVVAQNTWSNGKWNEELNEKLPSCMLPGETIQLFISCQNNGFSTSINGVTLKILPYRIPLQSANVLLVQGDITILSIKSSSTNN